MAISVPTSTKRLRLLEIASEAGVSTATVSRVLNGHPDVAQQTREHVQQILTQRGYVASRTARALARGRSGLIGLTIPDLQSYAVEILKGVEQMLDEQNVRLVLSITHHEPGRESHWLSALSDGLTDGVLIVLASGQSAGLESLQRQGIPFVIIDHRADFGPEVPSVAATNWSGGRTATAHLIELGHRRIGAITGPAAHGYTRDRLAGYRAALDAAGIPFDPLLVRTGDNRQPSGLAAARALLAGTSRPTALFVFNDPMAFGALEAAREAKLRVPADLSIVGFDDIPDAALQYPQLTTIRQPLVEMGRAATQMLLNLIADKRLDSRRVELTTTLVARHSTGPAPRIVSSVATAAADTGSGVPTGVASPIERGQQNNL